MGHVGVELDYLDACAGGQPIQGRAQSAPHAEPAQKDSGFGEMGQGRAGQVRQGEFRAVGVAVHQDPARHGDQEIAFPPAPQFEGPRLGFDALQGFPSSGHG